MNFFYYIFYRICSFYEKKGIDRIHPEIYASAVVSMMQISVLLFLFSLCNIRKFETKEEFMLFVIPLPIVIMIVNALFIFTKERYKKMETKWQQENKKTAYLKGIFIAFWIILIFPFIIGSVHFFNS